MQSEDRILAAVPREVAEAHQTAGTSATKSMQLTKRARSRVSVPCPMHRSPSFRRCRCLLLLSFALAACGHARPALEREPVVLAPPSNLPEIALRIGAETVLFVLGTGGHPATIPLGVAQRTHLFYRDHSKLDVSAGSRTFFVDYYGQKHADLVAYSVPVEFPSGLSAKFDFNILSMTGAYANTGSIALQDLIDSRHAVTLDLSKGEIRFAGNDAAVAAFRAEHPDSQAVEFRSCGVERSTAVEINGVKTWLEVSTGSSGTFLSRNSPALATMMSVTGKIEPVGGSLAGIPALHLGLMPIRLAGHDFQTEAVVVPTVANCRGIEGALGMDVLRYCSFVWSEDALWMSCHPP